MADTRGELVESNCPFCDAKQFEERLIAEVDGFYIIATLGQITDGGYVLVFPKRHVSCVGAMEESELNTADALLRKIDKDLAYEYAPPWGLLGPPLGLMFEHGIVGQTIKHAHVHIVSGYCNLSPLIQRDFPKEYSERQILTQQFSELRELGELYKKKQSPYLVWCDSNAFLARPMVLWDPPAPSQYLRVITAEALSRPERANWRTMDPELDKRLWSDTVRRLKPYFV